MKPVAIAPGTRSSRRRPGKQQLSGCQPPLYSLLHSSCAIKAAKHDAKIGFRNSARAYSCNNSASRCTSYAMVLLLETSH